VEVFYTHSIEELSQMAVDLDADFQKIRTAKKLDQYYISTRYPNGLPGGVPSRYYDDPKEAEDAMILAKKLIDLVAEKLHEC
jgi:HEPN domain-containing protein